jgi:hypothetical protein
MDRDVRHIYSVFIQRHTVSCLIVSRLFITFSFSSCELVDFDLKKERRGMAYGAEDCSDSLAMAGVKPLVDWIISYFTPSDSNPPRTINDALSSASPVTLTNKLPLIFQQKGHSRMVIGYEILKGGDINLLVFDSGWYVIRLNYTFMVAEL